MSNNKKIVNFNKHQVLEYEKESLLFLEELLSDIPKNIKKLEARKNHFAQAHNIPTLKNRELIVAAQKNNIVIPDALLAVIQKRAVRTVSGVSPIGMLTKPFDCPGKCTYCPTEDRMPKSYMKNQPAAARALRNNFDPFGDSILKCPCCVPLPDIFIENEVIILSVYSLIFLVYSLNTLSSD